MLLHFLIQSLRKDMGAAAENVPLRIKALFYGATSATTAAISVLYGVVSSVIEEDGFLAACKQGSISLLPAGLLVIIFLHDTVMSISYKRYLNLMRILELIDSKRVTCFSGILTGIAIPLLACVSYFACGLWVDSVVHTLGLHGIAFIVIGFAMCVYVPISVAIAIVGWLFARLYADQSAAR